jgi:tellurite methyltransferase
MTPPITNQPLQRDWNAYYNAVEGRPPRETLLKALDLFEATPTDQVRVAVDLGCGDGRDTVALLQRGWRVLGVDAEPKALERLQQRTDCDLSLLETQLSRFEAASLPANVDLINSSFALPFCPPAHFPRFWSDMVTALKTGGRFSGQLFGDQDSWASDGRITHLTREQVEQLLQPFTVEFFEEENHPGKTALGETKHWHLFHIVARKH